MQLGFVSAILGDLTLESVFEFASQQGFAVVEVMCWPVGKADRRYAGVTHIDVASLSDDEVRRIGEVVRRSGVSISGLGYYPNPLAADEAEATIYIEHLKLVISAAQRLGLAQVNTFIGRDPCLSVEQNWPRFDARWPSIIAHAEQCGVRIGIENCPMFFGGDEWPGGKNLAVSPSIWREMFRRIPSPSFGLNYDPSHMAWQMMDPVRPIREFAERIFHVHAKDAKVHRERLDDVGVLALPLDYHSPKLPGLGDVDWGAFFSSLHDIRYRGPVCIEVEDRAYEGTLADRQRALVQSKRFLEQYC